MVCHADIKTCLGCADDIAGDSRFRPQCGKPQG